MDNEIRRREEAEEAYESYIMSHRVGYRMVAWSWIVRKACCVAANLVVVLR